MGIGDEIMASGHARTVYNKHGRRVVICDRHGTPRWSGMWRGLHWIAQPGERLEGTVRIKNSMQCRPYIAYPFNRYIGMTYSGWRARDHRGFIQLAEDEMAFAASHAKTIGPFVVIEPNVKPGANQNKQWGMSKWQELADILRDAGMNPHQMGVDAVRLEGVPIIPTPTFRHGAAMMKFAKWSYLPDGGLHHAAAALGLPATVLWGGANDPEYLGYPEHHNVFFPTSCRVWMPCQHCRTIWRALRPADVFEWSLQHIKEWKWQRSQNL